LVVAEAAGFVQMGPRWANISDLDLCTVPSIRYPSQSLFYIYLLYNYIYIYLNEVVLFCFCCLGCSIYIQHTSYIYICDHMCIMPYYYCE
jgi:hypothetical protein